MSLVSQVLSHVPDNWAKCEYGDHRFKRFSLTKGSSEYNSVYELVKNKTSDTYPKIERIQNPYLYGRYIVSKTCLATQNLLKCEVRAYKVIPKTKIDLLCEYNYDIRRIFGKSGSDLIFTSYCPNLNNDSDVIIVFRVLSSDESDSVDCERDSEFYPEYIVY